MILNKQQNKTCGRIWKLGDHVNTDLIFPGKYLYDGYDKQLLAKHALEPVIDRFYQKVEQDDILVAGDNFGCGSSREQAVMALKYAGIRAIVAKSFSRIFFRNAINHGLPPIECPELVDLVNDREELEIDWENHTIRVRNQIFNFPPFSEPVKEILDQGGLLPHLKKRFKK